MKYNIYQIAYSIESLNPIHPSFKIFDQTKNPFPEYREAKHMIDFFDLGKVKNNDQFYGLVSPKFLKKMNKSFSDIENFILQNCDSELIIFNSDPKWSYFYKNVWQQGLFFHPGINKALKAINENENNINLEARHDLKKSSYSNYWIAKFSFWEKYIKYLKKFDNKISSMPFNQKKIFLSKAENHFAPIYPFVFERLLSNYLTLHKKCLYTYMNYTSAEIINSATTLTDKILLKKYIDIIDDLDREGNEKLLKELLKNIDRIRMSSNNQNFIKKLYTNARLILKQKIF